MKVNVYLDDVRRLPYDAGPISEPGDRQWILVRDPEFVKWLLEQGVVHEMSLDHDLGLDVINGCQLLDWMEETGNWPSGDIHVHSDNPVGVIRMRTVIGRRPEED